MSNWKIKAAQHFLNNRSPEKLREIPVPEWERSVYYFPVRSIEEDRAIKIGAQKGARIGVGVEGHNFRVDSTGGHVTELIMRARDQHGERLFGDNEFEWITQNLDLYVVQRVVGQMEDEVPGEDAKK